MMLKKFFKKIVILINLGIALCLLFAMFSPNVNPQSFWLFSFFGLFFPVIFLSNIFIGFIWLFFDFKWSLLSFVLCIFCYSHFINFNKKTKATADSKSVSVATYNVMSGWNGKNKNREADDILEQELNSKFANIDIVVLQESNQYVLNLFEKVLDQHHTYNANKGVLIFSKYKILNQGVVDFGTKTNSCLWVDLLKSKKDTIRVYGLHLQSNRITKDADAVAKDPNLQERKTWLGIRNIAAKYKRAVLTRCSQLELIKKHMNRCKYPMIIAGDFNDPSLSYVFKELSTGMNDSFLCAGNGLGITYAGSIPLLRIDHILFGSEFEVTKSRVIKSNFSDHYPVIGEAILVNE